MYIFSNGKISLIPGKHWNEEVRILAKYHSAMLLSFMIGLNSPNLSAALCIKFAPAHAMLVKFKVLLANQLNLLSILNAATFFTVPLKSTVTVCRRTWITQRRKPGYWLYLSKKREHRKRNKEVLFLYMGCLVGGISNGSLNFGTLSSCHIHHQEPYCHRRFPP